MAEYSFASGVSSIDDGTSSPSIPPPSFSSVLTFLAGDLLDELAVRFVAAIGELLMGDLAAGGGDDRCRKPLSVDWRDVVNRRRGLKRYRMLLVLGDELELNVVGERIANSSQPRAASSSTESEPSRSGPPEVVQPLYSTLNMQRTRV